MENSLQQVTNRNEPQSNHVIFLHEKLARRKTDRYLVNLVQAYHHLGHHVTLFTSQYNRNECVDEFKLPDDIKIKYSGWWIPRSIFGYLRGHFSTLKSLCMAFRLAFNPPEEKPDLIILDVSMVALYILHLFTDYQLYYIQTFDKLRSRDEFCEHATYTPTLFEAKCIKVANEIIVETAILNEIFKKSYPSVTREANILYPAVDVGLWKQQEIQIQRILPDLLENTIIFLSIGKFKRSSNFKLALDAFELLLQLIADSDITTRFQLVIAGNCRTLEEKLYYNELVYLAKERVCASQVSFLKQLPIVHEKTLIMESAVIVHPAKSDVYADFILKAMSLGKPIVATNRGIATRLLQNRVSGITVEPDANAFAQVLKKLMMSPHLQSFMGEIARDEFEKNYSFKSFCLKVSDLTEKIKLSDEFKAANQSRSEEKK